MKKTREQIYNITHRYSKSRELTSILIRAYKRNLDGAYKALLSLPNDKDRLRLLRYVDKNPRLSEETIRKMVDTYLFFRVTLKNNPEYYLRYKTNNFSLLESPEDRLLLAKFVTNLPTIKYNMGR